MIRHFGWWTAAAACVVAAALEASAGGQTTPKRADEESLEGKDSFRLYCAPCHGSNARGGGPVASALKTPPPDLTLLAYRNGGVFPRDQVRAYVTGTGRMLPSHGPAEMPVWGPTFRGFESDARTRTRIRNVVAYLEAVQRRTP